MANRPAIAREQHQGTRARQSRWGHERGRVHDLADASPSGEPLFHKCWVRRRRALPMTLTDDRAMAAAAIIGDSNHPKAG